MNIQIDVNGNSMENQSSYKDKIEEKLQKARHRYNFFIFENIFLAVLAIGTAMALTTLIVGKFIDIPFYVYIIIISSFSVYFFTALVVIFKKCIGRSEAAGVLDKKMDFKERLVTGLEYAEQKEKSKFLDILVKDITSKLDGKSIKSALPHKTPKAVKYFVPVAILLLLLIILPHLYKEESEQIVSDIKKSVVKIPDLIRENLKKISKPKKEGPEDETLEKKVAQKQEEKPDKSQQEQNEDETAKQEAGTSNEKQVKKQEKPEEKQLTAQAQKDNENSQSKISQKQDQKKPNTLQDEISKLLSSISSMLNKLENKTLPEDKTKSKGPQLASNEKTNNQEKKGPSNQTPKTDSKQEKEQDQSKTADSSIPNKETSEQEQKKNQKEKQPPKIPESKLLQKLAQLLSSPNDPSKLPMGLPLGGKPKDQDMSESMKDKIEQSKQAGPSSQGGTDSSQQGPTKNGPGKENSTSNDTKSAGTGQTSNGQSNDGTQDQSSGNSKNTTNANNMPQGENQSSGANSDSSQGGQSGNSNMQSAGGTGTGGSPSSGTGGSKTQQSQQQGPGEGTENKDKQGGTQGNDSRPSQQPGKSDGIGGSKKDAGQSLNDKSAQANNTVNTSPNSGTTSRGQSNEDLQDKTSNIAKNTTGANNMLQGKKQSSGTNSDSGQGKQLDNSNMQSAGGTGSSPSSGTGGAKTQQSQQQRLGEGTENKDKQGGTQGNDSRPSQQPGKSDGIGDSKKEASQSLNDKSAQANNKTANTGTNSDVTPNGQNNEGTQDKTSDIAKNTTGANNKPQGKKQSSGTNLGPGQGGQPGNSSLSGAGNTNGQKKPNQETSTEGKITEKQEGVDGPGKSTSQIPEKGNTKANGKDGPSKSLNDKIAQAGSKIDKSASQTPLPSNEKKSGPGDKQMNNSSDSNESAGMSMSSAKEMAQKGEGSEKGAGKKEGEELSSGKGAGTGQELSDSKTGRQQGSPQGSQAAKADSSKGLDTAKKGNLAKGQEEKGSNGNNKGGSKSEESTSPKQIGTAGKDEEKKMGAGDAFKVAQLGKSKKPQSGGTGQVPDNTQGTKGKSISIDDLKDQIMNQMESLSSQIAAIEREMGIQSGDKIEIRKDLPDIRELKPAGNIDKDKQSQKDGLPGIISEITSKPGNKPGEKLYSEKPENIETSGNYENFDLKIKGIIDENGTKRKTMSIGKGKASVKRKLPTVGYDGSAELSTEQADDDAIKKTSIPLEYEEIIKMIHSEKE